MNQLIYLHYWEIHMDKLKRMERFQKGIEKYGYDSDFRKEIENLLNEVPIDRQKLDDCFDKYNIPREKQ
jgi:hypothetical protein